MDQPTPVATVPTSIPTTDKSPALTRAVREELEEVLSKEAYVTLKTLGQITEIAHHGRVLVAVRNPMTRFDARAVGASSSPSPMAYGTECDEGWGSPMMNGGWVRGPMNRHRSEHEERYLADAVKESPLAKALREDLLSVVTQEDFGPAHLLEVEQLASQGKAVLQARLGYNRGPTRPRGMPHQLAQPWAPGSSEETFGAAAFRELAKLDETEGDQVQAVQAIAAAKEAGLDDLAEKLTAKLLAEPKDAALGGAGQQEGK